MTGKPKTKVLVENEESPEAKGANLALEHAVNATALVWCPVFPQLSFNWPS
jgi:hypothetical protein